MESGDGMVGCYDAKTGKILWTQDFATGNTANCPTPAFSDGYVFWSKPKPIAATLNTKAARQLRMAEAYLKVGLKDKAAGILKKVVADFPNTIAANAAAKKLHELSGANKL